MSITRVICPNGCGFPVAHCKCSTPSIPSVSAAPEDEIEARLREIEGELAAVFAQGPRGWWWSRSYELPGDPDALEKHWALTNAESEADGKVVSGWLVLATTAAHDYDGRPLDETRHLRLIAHAPEHLDWALAQIHALRSRLTAAETERDEARHTNRWSVQEEEESGSLYVCKGDHERGEKCHFEEYVPRARLAASEAETARLREALDQIATLSDKPADHQWRDEFGDYNDIDDTNHGDIHAHGVEEGLWRAALIARATPRAPTEGTPPASPSSPETP